MKIKILSWLLLLASLTVACADDPFEKKETASRTVLIYMIGNNSLSSWVDENTGKLMDGVTQQGLQNGNLLVYANKPGSTVLLRIRQAKNGKAVKDTLETYTGQNSADPKVLNEVINRVINNFPADSYGLGLWSHGTAWLPSDLSGKLRAFGQDGNTWMEIADLASGIPDKKFDFILFDACYMASAEVIYELRNKANYIIGSPTEVLADGFPYARLITPMFASSAADVTGIAKVFYDYYQNNDMAIKRYGTVSVSATAPMQELVTMIREILNGREKDIYALPVEDIQKMEYLAGYKYHALYDLDDFISRMATTEQYARFQQCLNKVILYKAATPEAIYAYYNGSARYLPMDHYSGLSIYLPQETLGSLNEWYLDNTEWAKAVYE